MVAGGREVEGWVGKGRGNVSSLTIPTPNQPLFIVFFPTYQCNTQQVVVKTVINAGQFHVSAKKVTF